MTIVEPDIGLKVVRAVCKNCDSVFDYTEEFNIRLKKVWKNGYEYAVCPICNNWLTRNIIDYEEEL